MYAEFESAFHTNLPSFQSYLRSLSSQNVATFSSFQTIALDATLLCATDCSKFKAFLDRGLGYANRSYIIQCLVEEDAIEQLMIYTSKYPDLFAHPQQFFDCSYMGQQCLQYVLHNINNDRETYVKIVGKMKIHSYDTLRILASHPRFKHHPHLPTDDIVSLHGKCIVLDTILYHLNLFKIPF